MGILLLLHLTTAAELKRCLQRKPSSRCTYTCNRRTGQWTERSCKAALAATPRLSVTKVQLKRCTGPKSGKHTAGCGHTVGRKRLPLCNLSARI